MRMHAHVHVHAHAHAHAHAQCMCSAFAVSDLSAMGLDLDLPAMGATCRAALPSSKAATSFAMALFSSSVADLSLPARVKKEVRGQVFDVRL